MRHGGENTQGERFTQVVNRSARGPRANNVGGNTNKGAGAKINGANQNRRDERRTVDKHNSTTAQPDPMKTSFGYIGADTVTRQRQGQAQRARSGGANAGNSGNRNANRNGGNRGGNR